MRLPQRVVRFLVRQAHHPTGMGGHIEGWVFGRRPSNVARNRWVVELLDVRPTDTVLELGCGPGVAVAALADRLSHGLVIGVDHSAVMIRQAGRRNAAAVRAGRVRLICTPVDDLHTIAGPLDAALAVNTVGMWPDPVARLREIRGLMRLDGTIALVSQPRCPGATAATSLAAARELSGQLTHAGFTGPRVELLELDSPAACVLAVNPVGPADQPA